MTQFRKEKGYGKARHDHHIQFQIVHDCIRHLAHASAGILSGAEGNGEAVATEEKLAIGPYLDRERIEIGDNLQKGLQVERRAGLAEPLLLIDNGADTGIEAHTGHIQHVIGAQGRSHCRLLRVAGFDTADPDDILEMERRRFHQIRHPVYVTGNLVSLDPVVARTDGNDSNGNVLEMHAAGRTGLIPVHHAAEEFMYRAVAADSSQIAVALIESRSGKFLSMAGSAGLHRDIVQALLPETFFSLFPFAYGLAGAGVWIHDDIPLLGTVL